MSADNFIQAFPFRKSTGAIVWRVMEVTMSGEPFETCLYLSTKARERRFLEFSGPDAANQAHFAARRLESSMDVCEYGLSLAAIAATPATMEDLKQRAIEAGYRVPELEEATDEQLDRLPLCWLLQPA